LERSGLTGRGRDQKGFLMPSATPDPSPTDTTTITEHEAEQVRRANATGNQPVVFVHGLWLVPSSWDRWAEVFETAGFTALTPDWPDDPETVEEANENPDVFPNKTVGQVADHYHEIIGQRFVSPDGGAAAKPAAGDV
jgi:non-heme chloroperoxidase